MVHLAQCRLSLRGRAMAALIFSTAPQVSNEAVCIHLELNLSAAKLVALLMSHSNSHLPKYPHW